MYAKLTKYVKRYKWRMPFMILSKLDLKLSKLVWWLRRVKIRMFCIAQVGRNTVIEKDVDITHGSKIEIGENVFIGRRSIFTIGLDDAKCTIGDDTWISHDFQLQASNSLAIGSKVLIGEFVSVRDTHHNYKELSKAIKDQADILGNVRIEDGVWIGRGCLILGRPEGITIGKGSIISANSTVHCSIPAGTVWGGSPAKLIKTR